MRKLKVLKHNSTWKVVYLEVPYGLDSLYYCILEIDLIYLILKECGYNFMVMPRYSSIEIYEHLLCVVFVFVEQT